MRMRMKPKRRGRLIDLQNWTPCTASVNKLLRPSINVTRYQEPVPMYRRDSVERVFNRHLNFIAAAQANDRPKDWR